MLLEAMLVTKNKKKYKKVKGGLVGKEWKSGGGGREGNGSKYDQNMLHNIIKIVYNLGYVN